MGAYAVPVNACVCNTITFTQTSSAGTPIMITNYPPATTQFGPSGNSISYYDFGGDNAQYMYVTVSQPAGWTVTISSGSAVDTFPHAFIAGPFSGTGAFQFTITVTAPASPGATATVEISAYPATSGTNPTQFPGSTQCTSVFVYLKTPTPFSPPPGVPTFPLGMGLLMALAFPALLLAKRKFAGIPKL